MTEPLFRVGELVGLVSIDRPDLNGQYHVRCVLRNGDRYWDRFENCEIIWQGAIGTPWVFILEGLCEQNPVGREFTWRESALRKIHKPSEYTFQELLTTIKNIGKLLTNVE